MATIQTPSFRLDGKRALVVGASSGIGQACAIALGEYGAEVTIAARREKLLVDSKKMIEDIGGKAHVLALDVTDIEDTKTIISQQQPFDILLNAAGLARHSAALATQEQDFDAVMRVNIKGAYFLNQCVAQKLITANKKGSLITISSQMAYVGGVDRAVYAATKHAVEGFTKSMAIEWGQYGIRVNTICPTFIRTALTQTTFDDPERIKWIKQKIKLGRLGEVEDIMGASVFLASDASSLITGSALMLDGGWTAG